MEDNRDIVMPAPAADETPAESGGGVRSGRRRKKDKPKKPPCAAYRAVDKYFGFSERGTNLKSEIFAGILMCVEVACFMMVTAMMLQTAAADEIARWTPLYYAVALISMISTILMGVICNAPFAQSISLGMVMLVIALLGNYAELKYANVMAIALVSNLVYMFVMLVKPAREWVFNAVPEEIRKVMPAAIGAFMIVFALIQTNVFTVNTLNFNGNITGNAGDPVSFFGFSYITFNLDTSDSANFYTYMPVIMAIVAFAVFALLKSFNLKHSAIIAFGGTTLVYAVCWAIRGNFTDYNLYAFFVPSYGGYMHFNTAGLSRMFNSQLLGQAFKTGFDFSALTEAAGGGAVALLFIGSVISFLVVGVCETGAAVCGHGYVAGTLKENGRPIYTFHTFTGGKAVVGTIQSFADVYTVNALSSVIGCALGAGPVAVRSESIVGASEGGKTGLSAIVAGLLLIVAVFNTFFNGIFINGTVAYGLMLYVGFMLLTSLKNVDFTSATSALPALLMVVVTAVSTNIAAGVAVGIIAHTLFKVIGLKFRQVSIGTYVLTVFMIVAVISMWYVF